MAALVSVIITTKNEEEHIGSCLESIKKQDYPQDKIEIIVVDNNSTDKTGEYDEESAYYRNNWPRWFIFG